MAEVKGKLWRRFGDGEHPKEGDTILIYDEETHGFGICEIKTNPGYFHDISLRKCDMPEKIQTDLWWMPAPGLPVREAEHVAG
jgi:hypothetical protein